MKKNIILLSIAVAVLSCAKEADKNIEVDNIPEAKGVTINVIAGRENTKTVVVDGETPSVQWTAEDNVKVFEVMNGVVRGNATSGNATISGGKASFKTTLTWSATGGSSYKYTAVYPASSVSKKNSDYFISLPCKQQLVNGNISDDSDILFSSVLDHSNSRVANNESIEFSFRRLGTLVRLTLRGIKAGETIQQVIINAPVSVAGSIQFDPITGTVVPESAFEAYESSELTLLLGDVVATGDDVVIWFRVMSERDWGEAGDQVSYEVITDKNVYRKTVTPPTVKFADGGLTKFGVDLGSSIVAPLDVPYSNDFEDNANGWFFIDADGDGHNWELGNNVLASASYDDGTGKPLTPDNWAFTPGIQMTENNYLSFWIGPDDPNWPYEHYAVYISQAPPVKANLADCTVLMPETIYPDGDFVELSDNGIYQHYVIPIPAQFENKLVYIGFRHFNSTDMYWIYLNSVQVVEGMPAIGGIAAYGDYLGQWSSGNKIFTIEQDVANVSYSISGFTDQGEYPVHAKYSQGQLILYDQIVNISGTTEIALQGLDIEDNTNGRPEQDHRVLFKAVYDQDQELLRIVPGNCYSRYIWITYEDGTKSNEESYTAIPSVLYSYTPIVDTNTYIYQEGFENGTAGWTFIDADEDGLDWYTSQHAAYIGNYSLFSDSYNESYGALTPDNWAFTPAIQLSDKEYYLSFSVTTREDYPEEHYAVYVTTTTPAVENLGQCTVLLEKTYPDGDPVETGHNGYQHYVISIPAQFENKLIYIGFRHFGCTDQYWLSIDNVGIIEETPVF